jgi:flagellin
MASINTNISAYYAQNNLRTAGASAQSSIARLSSGNKIVKASDDVAALSIGTILRTDVNTLKTALVNANQGSTLLQVADGALSRVGEILQRQKALATQANSGTLSATERGYLGQEFSKLTEEIDRIVDRTTFNGIGLIDGTLASDSTSLATEVPTAITAALRSGESALSSNVFTLTSGVPAFTVSAAGTGDTINLLKGSLATATVTGKTVADAGNIQLTINIGGVNFQSASFDTAGDAAITPIFTAMDGSGAAFTLSLADPDNSGGVTDGAFTATATDTEANTYAALVQTGLRSLDLYQTKVLENTAATDASAITAAKFDGTVLQDMTGADFKLVGKDFDSEGYAPSISGFKFTSLTSTAFKAEVTINGVSYSTANKTSTATGVTINNDADFTNEDISGVGNGILRLVSADDSNSYIDISLVNASAGLDGRTQSKLDGIEDALNGAFGSGSEGGVGFQVGTDADDKVSISLSAVSTNSLYVDNDGAAVTMDLVAGDLGDIQEALDNAINTVTSRRADVGALQSRFNYASSALESSIQNLDAARGTFLDADISEESTSFARAQVLQQAAISVLAQANQIPQNLLKLIG